MAKKVMAKTKLPRFAFEYVTSGAILLLTDGQGDGVGVDVVNDSSAIGYVHLIIYKNTGAGAVTVSDSGRLPVAATWRWALGFNVQESGEYWLRIRVTSQFMIPHAVFERFEASAWRPIESYRPGDFACFRLFPSRKRIWSV